MLGQQNIKISYCSLLIPVMTLEKVTEAEGRGQMIRHILGFHNDNLAIRQTDV